MKHKYAWDAVKRSNLRDEVSNVGKDDQISGGFLQTAHTWANT